MTRALILWDGKRLPEGLKRVPPGRYRLELVDEGEPLGEAEDRGIVEALHQLDAGEGIALSRVIADLRRSAEE